MKGVTVITHPLVQHGLTRLRDQRTGHDEFRRLLGQMGVFLVYEAMRSFAVRADTARVRAVAGLVNRMLGHHNTD